MMGRLLNVDDVAMTVRLLESDGVVCEEGEDGAKELRCG
jgi:hypothetical protein